MPARTIQQSVNDLKINSLSELYSANTAEAIPRNSNQPLPRQTKKRQGLKVQVETTNHTDPSGVQFRQGGLFSSQARIAAESEHTTACRDPESPCRKPATYDRECSFWILGSIDERIDSPPSATNCHSLCWTRSTCQKSRHMAGNSGGPAPIHLKHQDACCEGFRRSPLKPYHPVVLAFRPPSGNE